jgi:hypothetical protein
MRKDVESWQSSRVRYVMRFQSYSENGDWVFRFSFGVGQLCTGGIWTINVLRIKREPSSSSYILSLKSTGEKKGVQDTGTFIRNLLMRWSANRTGEPQLHSDPCARAQVVRLVRDYEHVKI